MYWQNLTSAGLDAIDRQTPVLLPVAAIEQHGPHLPLATDRIINDFFCGELDKQMGNELLILPILAVGCSEHHMDYPGSLTLTHETFAVQIEEILESVTRHGFTNLVILNSHGGNRGICQVVGERFGASYPDCQVVVATWWQAAAEKLLELNETGFGGVGHACDFETSLVMLATPELVNEAAIQERQNISTYEWAEMDLLRSPRASLYRSMKDSTHNGAIGDPKSATREKGETIRDAVIPELAKILRSLPVGPT